MIDHKVSYRYAESLLQIAEEKNILDTIAKSMELIKAVLVENPGLKRMLINPVIKPQVKISILGEIFKSKVDEETLSFLVFVIHKNREDLLYDIINKFLELRDEKLGIVNIDVKTAFVLDDNQKQQIKNKLEKKLSKKARLNFEIDRNVLGGFIAKVGDTVYDASLKHQLDLLKKEFLSGNLSLN
jgi:F-type H+-transporting ATPase subunit delta